MIAAPDLIARFLSVRAEARAECRAALVPWRDGRGYWHLPPFPWRAWLRWGACQAVLLVVLGGPPALWCWRCS